MNLIVMFTRVQVVFLGSVKIKTYDTVHALDLNYIDDYSTKYCNVLQYSTSLNKKVFKPLIP